MKRNFTLIELVIVVAVIALLAAMVQPVLSQVRPAAEAAGCADNLRQLGTYMSMYAESNGDCFPAFQGNIRGNDQGKWQDMLFSLYNPEKYKATRDRSWIHYDDRVERTMRPYGVFGCPANPAKQDKKNGGHRHYGMNTYLGTDNPDWVANRGASRQRGKVSDPARRMLMLDIDRGEKTSWREVGIHMRKYMTPGEEDLREGYAFRHGENQANVAFVDGHVDARKWAEIPSGWNSDGGVFWSGDKQ